MRFGEYSVLNTFERWLNISFQVLAEKGMALNYDELVVYREDAIRPSYLVMYEG